MDTDAGMGCAQNPRRAVKKNDITEIRRLFAFSRGEYDSKSNTVLDLCDEIEHLRKALELSKKSKPRTRKSTRIIQMNITHPEMVSRLMKPKADLKFTPEQADMIHSILGISGECGEILDAIKKHVIYGKPLDRENLVEELGDMEFYMEHLRKLNGITREETIAANVAKLANKAKERADKSGDGWIEWKGGKCPVDKTVRVATKWRDGHCAGIQNAGYWIWKHVNSHCDIIAYRRIAK